jgi:hypothetical protein
MQESFVDKTLLEKNPARTVISLGKMHTGQIQAHQALKPYRYKVLRCGRRFGKTEFGKIWISQGLVQGWECAWLAPQHKIWSEAYVEIKDILRPLWDSGSMGSSVIRLRNGGRLDFWTLGNEIAGRSRRYRRVVIDEAAFTKNGDNKIDGSMMEIWEKAIKPTLFDYEGEVLVCSNSAGKNPDNFFYNICTDPKYGFGEYHATTRDNPTLPKRAPDESLSVWSERRDQLLAGLIKDNDPLVYQQEYLAEFVDWAGVAFFARDKLLENGQPIPYPKRCDVVFAVIDTASKTGTEHNATAVTFFAADKLSGGPLLLILDWDIVQIEGALLETWLPMVFGRLEELSRLCSARHGSIGAMIEDKNSGTILLQQAQRRQMPAQSIESKLTAMGKDERALSVSGYVYRGNVKYTDYAFNKITTYKNKSRNHLVDQIESFRIGDKDNKREDDLLDTFCYGIAVALGDGGGF